MVVTDRFHCIVEIKKSQHPIIYTIGFSIPTTLHHCTDDSVLHTQLQFLWPLHGMFAAGNYSILSEINIWANEALKLQCGDPVIRNKYHLGAIKSVRREFFMSWCGRAWNNICWYIEIEKNDCHFTDNILKYFSETKFLIEIAQKIIVALYTIYPVEYAHDDVIKWKHLPRYWPLVRGIHWSPVIPRTKASDADLWCFLLSTPGHTIE